MSQHVMFRRQPVDNQVAEKHSVTTIPAPTRGIIETENYAFMKPGAALISDNWAPTLRGVKLRGGCIRWCDLHALDIPIPPVPDATRKPVVSAFEYQSGNQWRMFAGQEDKLFDVTAALPVLVKDTQNSGNYAAVQLANAADDWMIVVNDAGDPPLRFDGAAWIVLNAGQITGPVGSAVEFGENLVYVWKYRNRLFFIEVNSMNAWYLGLNSVGGVLEMIPLSGAATKGGKLLFGATWSIDAGDGIDDKCVFVTDLGECLIFTGSNPADPANWRQEGRYQIPPPMGMNAHISIGGDLLIATVDGIIPISKAITKTGEELQLAAISHNINVTWHAEAIAKRAFPWTMQDWPEYGGIFVTLPGGAPGKRMCLGVNAISNAWCRFVGWDVMCFIRMRGDMFFGTQDGIVMQADRTGKDDGAPYVATLVGGWGTFGGPNAHVWLQARATFSSSNAQPFQPQLAAATDYIVKVPTPPAAGPDPGIADVWDQGLWDQMLWDQPAPPNPAPVRNTMWVSIGRTGYAHAPIVQVTVAQAAKPNVELIAIDCTYKRMGVNV